jgi:hypothetical protein
MVLALYSFVHLVLTGPCSHHADQSRHVVDASEIRFACKDYQQLHLASNFICMVWAKKWQDELARGSRGWVQLRRPVQIRWDGDMEEYSS